MTIRPALPADHPAIREVVTAAFGDRSRLPKAIIAEAAVVEAVRAEGAGLVELVAEDAGNIVGHVLFSRMTVTPPRFLAALGPVAVSPDRQNSGFGSALCRAGIEAVRALGAQAIVVLGHPAYYPRFGFSTAAAAKLASPYAGRPAFMAMALRPGALEDPLTVAYPAAFG